VPGHPDLVDVEFVGLTYDDIFEKTDLTFLETML